MAGGERLTLFPQVEDSQFAPFELTDSANGLHVMEHAYPPPPRAIDWAGSVDTEGDEPASIKRENREIPIKLRVREPQDAAATNLVTKPSFGDGLTTPWSVGDGAYVTAAGTVLSVADDLTAPALADKALKVVTTAATSRGTCFDLTLTNGVTYAVQIRVKRDAGGSNLRISIGELFGGFTDRTLDTNAAPSATDYDTYTLVFTATATGIHRLYLRTISATVTTFYVDAVSIVAAAAVTPFFNGDTPGCDWTGARNGSSSTRPAPGGPRRDGIVADLQQAMETVIERRAGVLRRIPPSGTAVYFDLRDAEADQVFDNAFISRQRSDATVKLIAKPYWRGDEEGEPLLDDFASDTIGSGAWAFDEGLGTLSVSGGQLVPSTTATKTLYRPDREFYDAEATLKITTGASVAAGAVALLLKRIDSPNYIFGYLAVAGASSKLSFAKKDADSFSDLQIGSNFTLSAATNYWLRFRQEGNKLTLELFTAAPTPQSTPAQEATYTLAGANATKFGIGAVGTAGIRISNSVPTDWRYDDFTVTPDVYVERTL